MRPDQLAELECHLAAGTDLPTALAAVADDQPRRSLQGNRAFRFGLLLGFGFVLLYLMFRQ